MFDAPNHYQQIPVPVTEYCVNAAAQAYDVPPIVLYAVMKQEAGRVGHESQNKNGTKDRGPMQINDVWANGLKKRGIDPQTITYNGCINVRIGAAILKKHYMATDGDWWKAIGNYHSKTPTHRDSYLMKVALKIKMIANGRLTKSGILMGAND